METVERIAVIGAGLMGTHIALDFARAGFPVTIADSRPEQLTAGVETMTTNLSLLSEKGLLPESARAVLSRVERCESLQAAVRDADLVVEAVTEDLALKQELFRQLDCFSPEGAILASNTSSFMPSSLALLTARRERVLVAHHWNPAHLIPLVELVPGPYTSPQTLETMRSLYEGMGKKPVVVRKETLGFIGNRLQFALYREALALVESGAATPEDVDTVVRCSFGRRLPVMGVFGTMDLGGLDVMLAICRSLFPDLAGNREPGPGLATLVAAGRLGLKTGQGWYHYTEEEAAALRRELSEELIRWSSADR